MTFSPLKFQVPLAAGGIALMAFNFLQYAIPHGEGMVTSIDFERAGFTAEQYAFYLLLVGIMLLFTVINIFSVLVYLKPLIQWLSNRSALVEFMAGPPIIAVGIFVPIAALAMTACVFFAPLAFFIPHLSANLQAMMVPGLTFFMFLWITLFWLEFETIKIWLSHPVDFSKLNFVWLLDVFSFGLVSLSGTGIAATANHATVVSVAAIASLFTLIFGSLLLFLKLAYLFYLQIRADSLPGNNFLPAFFILIPISCLYGFSYFRIGIYLKTYFFFDMRIFLFFSLVLPYVIAINWGLFCLYFLGGYLKKDFLKGDFAPPQWSMV